MNRLGEVSSQSKPDSVLELNLTPMANCEQCKYAQTLRTCGMCHPGDVCVKVDSGRQIDRFFRKNPEFAASYLMDVFWERRAIAARYCPLVCLPNVMADPDEVVRRAISSRIPLNYLDQMLHDPDREVRITVALRLSPEKLEQLANDPDYLVRVTVARRLPAGRLFRMICDPEEEVRKTVAERLPQESLALMASDESVDVRVIVAQRSDADGAAMMLSDSHWLVRYYAAASADIEYLIRVTFDPVEEVRDVAKSRLEIRSRSLGEAKHNPGCAG